MIHIRPTTLACLFTILTALATPLTAASLPSSCDTPWLLSPRGEERRAEDFAGTTHCYRLDLATAGLLHLDVAAPADSTTGLRLEMVSTARFTSLERAAAERLSLAGAGTYYLVVLAEDPRHSLPSYRVTSRFVELDQGETDGELEVEPEGLRLAWGEFDHGETDGELEVEPEGLRVAGGGFFDQGETDGELEVEPEGLRTALCGTGDDHGDSLTCATSMKGHVYGEIDNGWGDDADVFRFQVRAWQTVEITAASDLDLHTALYDRAGQRLAAGSRDDGARMVRTLGPGTYFVRVEGSGSAGTYSLVVHELGR